tara:strand:- start:144 stop:428 length:285 start_codon:yes stop_codon:yes gene_type:complete
MKVQKIVSLDRQTAEIAAEMRNFSKWVRDCIRAYDLDEDLGSLFAGKKQWRDATKHIAYAFADYVNAHTGEETADAGLIITAALEQRRITEWVE